MLFTHGQTFPRLSIGIIGGKDILNKVFFMFISIMESIASFIRWVVAFVNYFLSQFSKSIVKEEFQMLPFKTPPQFF